MKTTAIIVLIGLYFLITCCNNKKGLELEIINKELFSGNSDTTNDSRSKNIIVYKLTNYDDVTYYFNRFLGSKMLFDKQFLVLDNAYMVFTDEENHAIEVAYGTSSGSECSLEEWKRKERITKKLGYSINASEKFFYDETKFLIHPNETIYFEWFVDLPNGSEIQSAKVDFNKNKKYNAKIFMYSDTINYKKLISRTDLKSIKENGYKVYHGIIYSKNIVPINFKLIKK